MGELVGIQGIAPSRRLELLPYTAGSATVTGNRNPARTRSTTVGTSTARAGTDLKMGLGPNLTLDATVNPDFGQVEADPAVVNLSAFEVFFDEKRPFFLEGEPAAAGERSELLLLPAHRRAAARRAPPGTSWTTRGNSTILAARRR